MNKKMNKEIKNYDEIIINEDTLVMLDIDNTVIKFKSLYKNWWKENEVNNKNLIEEWIKIITEEEPIMLDFDKYMDLLTKIKDTNSDIIYITARNENLNELTYQQLTSCGIFLNREQIHYSYPKGIKIKSLLEQSKKYKKYIFVDDHLDNIEDVQKHLTEYIVDYYLMNHINLK
jgi:uncharacterized HAD superfamily protein